MSGTSSDRDRQEAVDLQSLGGNPPYQQPVTVLGTGTKDAAHQWVSSFLEELVFKSLSSSGCLEIHTKTSFESRSSVTLTPLERKKSIQKADEKRIQFQMRSLAVSA